MNDNSDDVLQFADATSQTRKDTTTLRKLLDEIKALRKEVGELTVRVGELENKEQPEADGEITFDDDVEMYIHRANDPEVLASLEARGYTIVRDDNGNVLAAVLNE